MTLLPIRFRRLLGYGILCITAGLFPLIVLWKNNLGQVPPASIPANLLYTSLFALAVYAAWLLIARSAEKAALLSAVTYLFVFSYGHLYNLVGSKSLLGVSIGYAKLFLACFLLFAALCLWILRAKRAPSPAFLLYPAALLVLLNLAGILHFAIQNDRPNPEKAAASTFAASNKHLPNIYYIVLDAYARSDILSQVIGYDNSAFVNALKERGFYIPDCAFSNYDGTDLTISSVLNYDMLDHLGVPTNSQGQFQAPSQRLIHDSKAAQVFRSYGYQFVTGRGYAPFNDIQTADVYLNYAIDHGAEDNLARQRFTSLYLNTTIFRVVSELYKNSPEKFSRLPAWLAIDRESDPSLVEASFWYAQNNYMFDSLEKIPQKPGSYFVYAHINAPHGPYVYRADGSFRYPLNDRPEKELYADMITYINRRVLQVVDTLQKSDPAPIIIIQADHGIHKMTTGLDKHKILSAYYLPGKLAQPPYPTITPVNDFRLILRNYFDPAMPLLPDTLWVKRQNDYGAVPAKCGLGQ